MIDGETLRVGDTFHDAKVVRIGLTEVVLRKGKTEQVLVMRPISTARMEPPKADPAKADPTKAEAIKVDAAKAPGAKLEELLNPKPRPQ